MFGKNDKIMLFQIMIFYSLLSFFIAPAVGYFAMKNKAGITYGMLIGIILSIILWYSYGIKKIELN